MAHTARKSRPQPRHDIGHAAALHQQGRLAEAERAYGAILAANPAHADAQHLLGVLRHQQGRNVEALLLLSSALKAAPKSADVLSNYGAVLNMLKRHEEALARFEEALEVQAGHMKALTNRADTLARLERYEDALAAYEDILAASPDHLYALNECGGIYVKLGRFEAALSCFDRALALEPTQMELHLNKGKALRAINQCSEALACFESADQARPRHVLTPIGTPVSSGCGSAISRAAGRITSGGGAEPIGSTSGANFPHRYGLATMPIEGKTILLHAEQGMGDTIQFARYASLVARRGANVILECPAELAQLLCCIEGLAQIVPSGNPLPPFDFHCPLPSLPLAFGTELATIPANGPYIWPAEERLAKWRDRVPNSGRMRIGICWAGSSEHVNDRNRSIALEKFSTILSAPGIDFVNLQKHVSEEEEAILREHGVNPLGQEFADFADTAAVMATLDLIVSVDTSVAHLGGAMGRAVVLLLPFSSDWRWLLGRTDSPWYPTMMLFRQTAIGDWAGPLGAVTRRTRRRRRGVSRREARGHSISLRKGRVCRALQRTADSERLAVLGIWRRGASGRAIDLR